jgi:hypothetical protein
MTLEERINKYLKMGKSVQDAQRLALEEDALSQICETCGDGFNPVEEGEDELQ